MKYRLTLTFPAGLDIDSQFTEGGAMRVSFLSSDVDGLAHFAPELHRLSQTADIYVVMAMWRQVLLLRADTTAPPKVMDAAEEFSAALMNTVMRDILRLNPEVEVCLSTEGAVCGHRMELANTAKKYHVPSAKLAALQMAMREAEKEAIANGWAQAAPSESSVQLIDSLLADVARMMNDEADNYQANLESMFQNIGEFGLSKEAIESMRKIEERRSL